MYSNLSNGKLMTGLLLAISVSLVSCKSEPGNILKGRGSDKQVVVVSGYSGTNGSKHVAKFWIDGKETALSDGTTDAIANSVSVSGNTVYTAGTDETPNGQIPVYWQNTTEVKLPFQSGYATANSVYISGSDTYIAGNDSISAVYWKNGIETVLDNVDSGSSASAIYVSGNDLYVAGKHSYSVVYWKNGNMVIVSTHSFTQNVKVNGISVVNGDAYVVGYDFAAGDPFPAMNYWINGVVTSLNTGTDLSSPHNIYGELFSVFTSGNDIYIAGMDETTNQMINHAVYWKNGVETVLPSSAANSVACSVFIYGNDVYIAGYEYNTGQPKYAVYWKNGVEVKLTDGSTETVATSIFVK